MIPSISLRTTVNVNVIQRCTARTRLWNFFLKRDTLVKSMTQIMTLSMSL